MLLFEDGNDYSGHVVRARRLDVSTEAGDAIRLLQHSSKLIDLKSFLDFAAYLDHLYLVLQE